MDTSLILVNEMTCSSYDQIRIHFYLSIRALKLSTVVFAIDEVSPLSAVLVDGTRVVRVLGIPRSNNFLFFHIRSIS